MLLELIHLAGKGRELDCGNRILAERYSREDGKYGHINNVVLGNEIDYAYDYNNIADKADII